MKTGKVRDIRHTCKLVAFYYATCPEAEKRLKILKITLVNNEQELF